jgi:hypothetical protein
MIEACKISLIQVRNPLKSRWRSHCSTHTEKGHAHLSIQQALIRAATHPLGALGYTDHAAILTNTMFIAPESSRPMHQCGTVRCEPRYHQNARQGKENKRPTPVRSARHTVLRPASCNVVQSSQYSIQVSFSNVVTVVYRGDDVRFGCTLSF